MQGGVDVFFSGEVQPFLFSGVCVFSPNSVFNTWGSYGSSKRPGG